MSIYFSYFQILFSQLFRHSSIVVNIHTCFSNIQTVGRMDSIGSQYSSLSSDRQYIILAFIVLKDTISCGIVHLASWPFPFQHKHLNISLYSIFLCLMNPFLFQQQSFQMYILWIPWSSLLATISSSLLLPSNPQNFSFTFRHLRTLFNGIIKDESAKMPSPPSFWQYCKTICFAVLYAVFLLANRTKISRTLASPHIDSKLLLLASNPWGTAPQSGPCSQGSSNICSLIGQLAQRVCALNCRPLPGPITTCPTEDSSVPAPSTPRGPNRDGRSFPLELVVDW